jgi:hypothetical protein
MTQLATCVNEKIYPHVDQENFRYFTILREPVRRFLSEWQHVKRGATWKRKNSKKCSSSEYEKCLKKHVQKTDLSWKTTSTWANVSLNEFVFCDYNPAFNRQTKMLANYDEITLFQCKYDKTQDAELLSSAKEVLSRSLAFFALNEFQSYSEILFENTFGHDFFTFNKQLGQSNDSLAEKYLSQIMLSKDRHLIEVIKKLKCSLVLP